MAAFDLADPFVLWCWMMISVVMNILTSFLSSSDVLYALKSDRVSFFPFLSFPFFLSMRSIEQHEFHTISRSAALRVKHVWTPGEINELIQESAIHIKHVSEIVKFVL
jgi:hypothetical protein